MLVSDSQLKDIHRISNYVEYFIKSEGNFSEELLHELLNNFQETISYLEQVLDIRQHNIVGYLDYSQVWYFRYLEKITSLCQQIIPIIPTLDLDKKCKLFYAQLHLLTAFLDSVRKAGGLCENNFLCTTTFSEDGRVPIYPYAPTVFLRVHSEGPARDAFPFILYYRTISRTPLGVSFSGSDRDRSGYDRYIPGPFHPSTLQFGPIDEVE